MCSFMNNDVDADILIKFRGVEHKCKDIFNNAHSQKKCSSVSAVSIQLAMTQYVFGANRIERILHMHENQIRKPHSASGGETSVEICIQAVSSPCWSKCEASVLRLSKWPTRWFHDGYHLTMINVFAVCTKAPSTSWQCTYQHQREYRIRIPQNYSLDNCHRSAHCTECINTHLPISALSADSVRWENLATINRLNPMNLHVLKVFILTSTPHSWWRQHDQTCSTWHFSNIVSN